MKSARTLLVLSVCLMLGLTVGGPSASADPPAPVGSKGSATAQEHRSEQANDTLARVEALVSGNTGAHQDKSGDHRDLTVALRDLRLQMDELPPAERKQAERYFLRPGQGGDPYIPAALPGIKCSANICVHWTETGVDAPNGSDNNLATTPTYVQQVLDTVEQLNTDYVAAGYRTPRRDGTLGNGGDPTRNDKVDIYIGDIGDQGLYGFCTTDDPKASQDPPPSWDVWAYCALDDDYAFSQFPGNTPLENMRVTAAHEYMHAVQYAYDFGEDGWILESTATWVEDEMFDGVNDNRQFLNDSPITSPATPLDFYNPDVSGFFYGVWIWWRFLTEKFPAKTGKLPKLVLDVWKRLDGAAGGPDYYSVQGLSRVLRNRETSLRRELQLFYAANRHPRTAYDEGAAYPAAKPGLKFGFGGAQRKAAFCRPRHMSACYVQNTPNGLNQRDWRLRLAFDAPPRARGGAFVVVVYKKSGRVSTWIIRLNRTGDGAKRVPFSSRNVNKVDVVFVNTSARFANCWTGATPFSCFGGRPRDDRLRSEFTARTFRS